MLQMEDTDTNQTLSLLKVKEALEDAGLNPSGTVKKNIGCVLGIGGGQKSSNEFYSRMNYVVVEKVLRKMGLPETDVTAAVTKFKSHFPEWRLDSFPGFLGNVTAGRCTNVFNLDGMNCVVDAACASSLVAVKVAIDELLRGDCETMIAGATCSDCSLAMYMAFSKTPVFSTKQSLSAYDKDTKGMLIGEGSVMYVLKKLTTAERDGDTVHAVIKACASSSDGKAPGIYAPTIEGQEQCIRRAYRHAGVDPATVTLVEGHGTGTPVGDAIELTALKNVLGEGAAKTGSAWGAKRQRVAVGSIKSQIGHLKAVAGAAGMLKVIMALKHKVLPASINVKEPPTLRDGSAIQDSCIYVNTRQRPWFTPPGLPRRAGVSSFGFGGSNYHCCLEEFEPEHTKAYRVHALPEPLLVAAPSPAALLAACQAAVAELRPLVAKCAAATDPSQFSEERKELAFAFSKFAAANGLRAGVPAAHARVGFVATSAEHAVSVLEAVAAHAQKSHGQAKWTLPKHGAHFRAAGVPTAGKVAALFSGQGSQYASMFEEAAMAWPPMRTAIGAMDAACARAAKPGAATSEVVYPREAYESEPTPDHDKELQNTLHAQPATTAVSVGAYDVFAAAGCKADFVAGHSLGELAALYAGGVLSRDAAFELVCHRAAAMADASKLAKDEAMAAVIGPNASDLKVSGADVWLANINEPSQVVISGSAAAVAAESSALAARGFRVVPLKVSGAFHTPLMRGASAAFEAKIKAAASEFRPAASGTRVYSNVTGGAAYAGATAVGTLSKHMVSSVKWVEQVRAMHRDGARVFVEFGPRATLTKFVEKILGTGADDALYVAVNASKDKSSDVQLREAAVQLAVFGVPLDRFDPWGTPNPFLLGRTPGAPPAKKGRGVLKLSAATFVAPRTVKALDKAMNDGYKLSGNVVASVGPSLGELDAKSRELDRVKAEAAKAQQQLAALTAKMHDVEAELADARSRPAAVAAPAPVAAAAPSGGVSPSKATEVVLAVLAAKTGYEPEMIEMDMNLETELGVDSIKRVEILSDVQKQLNVEAQNVAALSRTQTVGEVVEAMIAELGGAASAAPAPAAAAPAPVAAAAPSAGISSAKATEVVLAVLAAKTGYEPDMIEMDMALETELGVDSIKRVEILSEVQKQIGIEAQDVAALSRTQTVGEVVDAMVKEIAATVGVKKSKLYAKALEAQQRHKLQQ